MSDPNENTQPMSSDERFKTTMQLYKARCWLWHMSCRLPLRDLERLNGVLRRLSDGDLRRVAAYAEGLAEWTPDPEESSDGSRPGTSEA